MAVGGGAQEEEGVCVIFSGTTNRWTFAEANVTSLAQNRCTSLFLKSSRGAAQHQLAHSCIRATSLEFLL